MTKSYAIVIQCFIKLDLLEGLVESLKKIPEIDEFDLIFWQDNLTGSKFYNEDKINNFSTVKSYIQSALGHFSHAIYKCNEINMGTCMTCKIAMDYAFINHDYVILTEDDTLFSVDSLKFFVYLYKNKHLDDPNIMGIAGESIFFDSRRQQATKEAINIFDKMRDLLTLDRYYTYYDFMPSTCFATTKKKWELFADIRGSALGDVDLCKYIKANHYAVIFPITAKVIDLGMQHPLGYSVNVIGLNNVSEIKNTYILSKCTGLVNYKEFYFNRDILYRMSAMMRVPILDQTRIEDIYTGVLLYNNSHLDNSIDPIEILTKILDHTVINKYKQNSKHGSGHIQLENNLITDVIEFILDHESISTDSPHISAIAKTLHVPVLKL